MHPPLRYLAIAAVVPSLLWTGPALAWGSSGHRLVTQAAVESLPSDLPAFMRQPVFAVETAEIARDPDRTRGSGRAHDSDRDPAHFVDGDDEGRALGGPLIAALPPTREDYDAALRAVGSDSWKAGYLPYSIVEGWQHLVKDLALWRADNAGVRLATDPAHKAWLEADRARRELLIRADLGVWSHFVGDASYPLHVSVHYNGWGKGPNPDGFTQEHIHVPLEGPYVAQHVTLAAVKAQMVIYKACGCAIDARVGEYLSSSMGLVRPFYALEKAGGFKEGDRRGVAFMTARIAAGAEELRDMIVDAWNASDGMSIGYPIPVTASEVEAGRAGDPYLLLHGND